MDGYEATKQIRSILKNGGAKQPIISAVTGHTEPSYVENAFMSSMNQVLSNQLIWKYFNHFLKKWALFNSE